MSACCLAIDVGSSSVKTAIVDVATGEMVGDAGHASYAFDFPTPDAAEVPVERVWAAVAAALSSAGTAALQKVPREDIVGIGLSCLTPALVLLDENDVPLAPSWTHLDRRARRIAIRTWNEVGADFLQSVGNRPLPGGISATSYAQLIADRPALRAKIHSYLHLNGWLGLKLTGRRVFDSANASFSGLYETLGNGEWSARWCGYFNVDRAWLPEIVGGNETIGTLLPAVAKELNLPAGLPVKIGTADTTSAMLAVDCTPDDLLHVVGTTQVLMRMVKVPKPDPARLVRRLGVGDSFVHVTHNPVGGVALEWMRALCFHDQPTETFYDATVPEAARRHTDVKLDPPFLGGDRLEIAPSFAGFEGLTLQATRDDLLASVIQAMRDGHARAVASLGVAAPARRVFLTGGGAPLIKKMLRGYDAPTVQLLEQGSLRGVARLFRQ